jgi:hypothetical protein
MGTSYSAPDIYHRIRGGRGSGGFSTNGAVTEEQGVLQSTINEQVTELNAKMNAAWQGEASTQAVSGAAPVASAAESASTSLNTASGAMNNQVNVFHAAYNSVVPMPDTAPKNNVINEMVSGLGVNTPLDQQINDYNASGQHNVQVYNNYSSQSAANAAQMPTAFDKLPEPHPSITVVAPTGSGAGGGGFSGTTIPGSATGRVSGSFVPPPSTGTSGTVNRAPGIGAAGPRSGVPVPTASSGNTWELPPNTSGDTTAPSMFGGGEPGGGPGFTGPGGIPVGGGPGGSGGFPGEEFGLPGSGRNGNGNGSNDGEFLGRNGVNSGFPGEPGFPGEGQFGNGPGGFNAGGGQGYGGGRFGANGFGAPGGANGYGGANGPGGYGAANGPSGTGSAGAGGGNTGPGGLTPGAEEAFVRPGMNSMAGVGGDPMMGPAGRGGQGEDDEEHKTAEYLQEADPDALFGYDQLTVPPVIGE